MVAQRLLLFDIDGTLVRAGEVDRAVNMVLGHSPPGQVRMSGKTDPQIVREYLALAGLTRDDLVPLVLKQLERELAEATGELAAGGRPCPGAPELLATLSSDRRLHLSVLTGNIEPNAVVKLSAFGLERWLDLEVGAYGSDSEDRRKLVPIALRRLGALRGVCLRATDVWVVGDTPRDFECAAAAGAHCLLVATGRFGADELRRLGADAVLPDLTSIEAVVDLVTSDL
jgi:phosphoglycolate phosphatase